MPHRWSHLFSDSSAIKLCITYARPLISLVFFTLKSLILKSEDSTAGIHTKGHSSRNSLCAASQRLPRCRVRQSHLSIIQRSNLSPLSHVPPKNLYSPGYSSSQRVCAGSKSLSHNASNEDDCARRFSANSPPELGPLIPPNHLQYLALAQNCYV